MRFIKLQPVSIDGSPSVRAWVIALAVVMLQLSAVAWGFAVLH
jgi:hypothetical protein